MDESEHPFSAYSREDTAEQPQSGAPPLVGGPDQPEPPAFGNPAATPPKPPPPRRIATGGETRNHAACTGGW